jgi:hypothetical protein
MFAENVEPLMELQSAVQEFVDTYVYIRGFNNYTVEKIQHIYTKAYKVRDKMGGDQIELSQVTRINK